ncbi:AbrB family transcriptional regulator [Bacillaceae bacterium Marseille-Q3522]|nr:AbrB family transcriptional regulator [Bacillaceae bacterium Marseille-Q3522]
MKEVSLSLGRTAAVAIIGAWTANMFHLPIPWMLGPLIAVMLGASWKRSLFYWPQQIRNTGMIAVGYSMGLSFTNAAVITIFHELPSIMLMTLLLMVLCTVLAFSLAKLSHVDFPTVLVGSIPGGLSQMILLAEETPDVNVSIVTFMQVTRVMVIVFLVPFFVFHLIGGEGSQEALHLTHSRAISIAELFPMIIPFAVISVAGALLCKKIGTPTPFIVGPIFGTAILTIAGLQGPILPDYLLNISQFMIGTYIGLLMKLRDFHHQYKIMILSIVSCFLLVGGSFVFSWLLTEHRNIALPTSLLSLTPGGMDQMGIMATEIHAELSIVAGYQLFRLFFIFFVVPPLLRKIFLRLRKQQKKEAVS